jgi:hypothetical protein
MPFARRATNASAPPSAILIGAFTATARDIIPFEMPSSWDGGRLQPCFSHSSSEIWFLCSLETLQSCSAGSVFCLKLPAKYFSPPHVLSNPSLQLHLTASAILPLFPPSFPFSSLLSQHIRYPAYHPPPSLICASFPHAHSAHSLAQFFHLSQRFRPQK